MSKPGSKPFFSLLKASIVSLSVSVGVLIALEAGFRFLFPQSVTVEYANGVSLARPDDEVGHVLNPNSAARVSGPEFTVSHQVSPIGLRDDSLYSTPRAHGSHRILLLGDSFVFGYGTSYEEIWPVIFERELQNSIGSMEVIKAGVPGYDTRNEVLFLKKFFARFQPDIVVLVFLPNDLFTNAPIDDKPSLPPIAASDDKTAFLDTLQALKRGLMANDWLYSRLYLMTPRRTFFQNPMGEEVREKVDITRHLLLEARDFSLKHGARFLVFSIPQRFQVVAASRDFQWEGTDVFELDRVFEAFAAREEIPWLTSLRGLAGHRREVGENLFYPLDGHLNPRGNRWVGRHFAQLFQEYLEESPPNPLRDIQVPR